MDLRFVVDFKEDRFVTLFYDKRHHRLVRRRLIGILDQIGQQGFNIMSFPLKVIRTFLLKDVFVHEVQTDIFVFQKIPELLLQVVYHVEDGKRLVRDNENPFLHFKDIKRTVRRADCNCRCLVKGLQQPFSCVGLQVVGGQHVNA